jgi:hypothetical protein
MTEKKYQKLTPLHPVLYQETSARNQRLYDRQDKAPVSSVYGKNFYTYSSSDNGQGYFLSVLEGSVDWKIIGKGMCHAGVENVLYESKSVKKNFRYFNVLPPKETFKSALGCPQTTAFILWLVNQSPWQEIFVEKDLETIKEKGYLLATKDIPTNFLMQAIILSRHTWEFPYKLDKFDKFVESGCHPTVALLFLYHMRHSNGSFVQTYWGQHNAFGVNLILQYYKNIMGASTPEVRTENGCSCVCSKYTPVDQFWGDMDYTEQDSLFQIIQNTLSKVRSPNTTTKITKQQLEINPFLNVQEGWADRQTKEGAKIQNLQEAVKVINELEKELT